MTATEPWVTVHRNAHDTEIESAAVAAARNPRRAYDVLEHLDRTGGDYDSEGAAALGLWLTSFVSARNALVRKGYAKDSGKRVINERGRRVIVWTVTDKGHEALKTGELV